MNQQFSIDSAASPLLQYDCNASSPYKTVPVAKKDNGTAKKEAVLGAITYSPNANRHASKVGEHSDSQSPAAKEGKIKNVHLSPSPSHRVR